MMYQKYSVKLQFREKLIGGIPKNPAIIDAWIDAKMKKSSKEDKEEVKKETRQSMDANSEAEKAWSGFKSDKKGLYIESRQIKAMMKETADTLQINRGKGSTAKKQSMQHGTFVKPEIIYLLDAKGKPKKKPDGQQERCVHVDTIRGPRVALKREDYVEKARIKFDIWCVIPKTRDTPALSFSELSEMFELGQENGIGSSRSQDFGKFDVKELQKIK